METIRISVEVPLSAALARGSAEYGYAAVPLTNADVTGLTAQARALLVPFDRHDGYVDRRRGLVGVRRSGGTVDLLVDRIDVAAVIEALERWADEPAAEARAEAAKREARIVAALAASDGAWIQSNTRSERVYYTRYETDELSAGDSGTPHYTPAISHTGPEGVYLDGVDRDDPRIVERMALVAASVLPSMVVAHEAKLAEWQAAVVARKAKEAEAKAKREEAAKAWASVTREFVIQHVPDYAEAARRGCAVARAARAGFVAMVERAIGSDVVEGYECAEEHPRPRQGAYDAEARVIEALKGVEASGDGMVVSCKTRIVRVDTCPEVDCKSGVRTCVEVTVAYMSGDEDTVYVYADAAPRHEEHGEDDA
jgi:hypothetical protein